MSEVLKFAGSKIHESSVVCSVCYTINMTSKRNTENTLMTTKWDKKHLAQRLKRKPLVTLTL